MTGVSSKFQLSSSVQTIVINYLKMGVYSGPSEVRHFCRISGEKTAGHFFFAENDSKWTEDTNYNIFRCFGMSGCVWVPYRESLLGTSGCPNNT